VTPHLSRYANQPANQARADADAHPYGTADTPMIMPMTLVQIGSDGIAYQDLHPLVMPDGRKQAWNDYGVHKCLGPDYVDNHTTGVSR